MRPAHGTSTRRMLTIRDGQACSMAVPGWIRSQDVHRAVATSKRSDSPGALPSRGLLRTARATFAAGSSSKPRGRAGLLCWVPALAGLEPAVAGGVNQAGRASTGGAWSPVVDEVAGGHCLAGDLEPPSFPLLRGLRRLIGGEQMVPAERTVPVLLGEQAERVVVQRGFAAPSPVGPVVGQGGVVGGRSALDHDVPVDAGPGELHQVATAFAVAEDPVVVPELAELAEVPADDPA